MNENTLLRLLSTGLWSVGGGMFDVQNVMNIKTCLVPPIGKPS